MEQHPFNKFLFVLHKFKQALCTKVYIIHSTLAYFTGQLTLP